MRSEHRRLNCESVSWECYVFVSPELKSARQESTLYRLRSAHSPFISHCILQRWRSLSLYNMYTLAELRLHTHPVLFSIFSQHFACNVCCSCTSTTSEDTCSIRTGSYIFLTSANVSSAGTFLCCFVLAFTTRLALVWHHQRLHRRLQPRRAPLEESTLMPRQMDPLEIDHQTSCQWLS